MKFKQDVIKEIRKHAQSSLSNEVAGLLLGRIRDNTLLVSDLVTGEQASSSTHVTLDERFLTRVASEYGRRGRKKSVVGWYHSHPQMGCFVSSIDFETQRRFQALFPDAVGVVIDPSTPETVALFRVEVEKTKKVCDYDLSDKREKAT